MRAAFLICLYCLLACVFSLRTSKSLLSSRSKLFAGTDASQFSAGRAAATVCLIVNGVLAGPVITHAKTEYPSLEKCFNAVAKEVDDTQGESIKRLREDIQKADWADVKAFSREYDSGFRGGVLKNVWKQLQGEDQKRGIEITNSFTFDLIALNKAARNEDITEANTRLDQVKADLVEFLTLRK